MGGPTRYTDPDGLEWLYNTTDLEFYWREFPSSPMPKAPGEYVPIEEGQIFERKNGTHVYLADEWSSNAATAFLPITMPNTNDFDYILPNAKTGYSERFEGIPAHAKMVRWLKYKNGRFFGLVEFEQYRWTELRCLKDACEEMEFAGPALAPTVVEAIPKWARYSIGASIYGAVCEFAFSPTAPIREAEGIETPASESWKASRMDHPSVANATDVACTVATAAIGPAPFSKTGMTTLLYDEAPRIKFFAFDGKFDFFFGRVKSSRDNELRSLQNLKDLETLGIRESEGGRSKLLEIFEEGLSQPVTGTQVTKFGISVTRRVKVGDLGAIYVRYFYRGGDLSLTPEISSILPVIFK